MEATQQTPEMMPQKVKRAALARWKIETLTGLLGVESLEKQAAMSHANQEAENRWAREKVWGRSTDTNPIGPKDTGDATGDDMRGHILGDVNHTYPAPVVYPPQPVSQSNALPLVATALAAMGIPGAAMLGYVLANKPAAAPASNGPQQYEQIELGLGRIQDFERQVQP